MLQMGFSQEEIQDSLVNQKYNDVMAAYLLLDYRNSEVGCSHACTHAQLKEINYFSVIYVIQISQCCACYSQF